MICYFGCMAVVTPTITTDDPHEYRDQMALIKTFSEGIHLDFADGVFAPTKLLPIDQAWRDDDMITHAHIMYQDPMSVIDDILHLEADLVILHAESENVKEALRALNDNGTRAGIALLPETSWADIRELDIDRLYDHVLVFGGHLGYQGGEADLSQLSKAKVIKQEAGDIEIGWDGGVNLDNVAQITQAGVDVLNVGGALRHAKHPQHLFKNMQKLSQT